MEPFVSPSRQETTRLTNAIALCIGVAIMVVSLQGFATATKYMMKTKESAKRQALWIVAQEVVMDMTSNVPPDLDTFPILEIA